MSTSGPDLLQQTAFLTSAPSGLANTTSIENGSNSAVPTLPSAEPSAAPSAAPTSASPAPPGSTTSAGRNVTGFTLGGKIGIPIGFAAVLAIFLWWFWPKRHRFKKNPDITTSITQDIKQPSVTTEVKKTDERHLSARVKTV